MDRREFILGTGSLAAATLFGKPVRSLVGEMGVASDEAVKPVPSALMYIQDGLVGMWDGIENAGYGIHDPFATIWKDLGPNSLDMEVYTSVAHFEHNCLRTPDTRPSGKIYGDTGTGIQYSACEFVTERIRPGGVLSFSGMANDRFFCYTGSYVQFADPYTMVLPDGTIPDVGTFSCSWHGYSDVTAYANGDELIVGSATNHWSRNDLRTTFGLGGSGTPNAYNAYQFTGRIYCVRLYNRTLTEDEVQYNHQIDKARFGI